MIEYHYGEKVPDAPMEVGDLIDSLNFCADDTLDCSDCKRYKYDCGSDHCVNDLLKQAAAMLEAQKARIAYLEHMLKRKAPCSTCKHEDQLGGLPPCSGCLQNIEERPGWELKED